MAETVEKKPLLGMTIDELKAFAVELGMPSFTGMQLAQWLYGRHACSIDEMTNISGANRRRLAEVCEVGCSAPTVSQTSADGTVKYLFPTRSGRAVETVFIPEGERATLCVSCQVGCRQGCRFCQTGRQGFQGNLLAADILNQLHSLPEREQITNIVFMGQGEPLDNLDEVLRAVSVLTAEWGWAMSPRRITVSTVGIRGRLERLIKECECHIAVSLHSPLHEERASLMPSERAMAIADVVEMLRGYDFSHQRRLSFEYIVFGGLNDSRAHARAVAKLLRGLQCRVNLIRFHDIGTERLNAATDEAMTAMRDYLTAQGIYTTVRASRGVDIQAGCGMLSTKEASRQGVREPSS